jgi:PPOX class probable F420-dependent enzyme
MTTPTSALDRLSAGKYVLLTTYRRDGTAKATPVWAVRDGDAIAVWTGTATAKVKRIRRNPAVTVAPSDFRGRPLGQAVSGRAEILGPEDTDRIRGLIKKKYWLTGPPLVNWSRWRRGPAATVGVRIDLD